MPTLIVGGRGSGKTTKCIQLAAENHAYIICRSYEESGRIYRYATELNLDIPFPISYDEFIRGEFCSRGIKSFIIDDVDDLVKYMARGVEIISMSLYGSVSPIPRSAAWEPPETKSNV